MGGYAPEYVGKPEERGNLFFQIQIYYVSINNFTLTLHPKNKKEKQIKRMEAKKKNSKQSVKQLPKPKNYNLKEMDLSLIDDRSLIPPYYRLGQSSKDSKNQDM